MLALLPNLDFWPAHRALTQAPCPKLSMFETSCDLRSAIFKALRVVSHTSCFKSLGEVWPEGGRQGNSLRPPFSIGSGVQDVEHGLQGVLICFRACHLVNPTEKKSSQCTALVVPRRRQLHPYLVELEGLADQSTPRACGRLRGFSSSVHAMDYVGCRSSPLLHCGYGDNKLVALCHTGLKQVPGVCRPMGTESAAGGRDQGQGVPSLLL